MYIWPEQLHVSVHPLIITINSVVVASVVAKEMGQGKECRANYDLPGGIAWARWKVRDLKVGGQSGDVILFYVENHCIVPYWNRGARKVSPCGLCVVVSSRLHPVQEHLCVRQKITVESVHIFQCHGAMHYYLELNGSHEREKEEKKLVSLVLDVVIVNYGILSIIFFVNFDCDGQIRIGFARIRHYKAQLQSPALVIQL
ncbi:uncharacterized protein A4U43_C04F1920 [Asparagus officinalis]|uniref:Uncharacterized protein n=1 Tax=Asparagus officinalis TaxID=4686 RepID=A0A5P1EXJ7_ASPOF|nr:uncharacterized protein A4U43_C04F1920 [Asparagus officinalis]